MQSPLRLTGHTEPHVIDGIRRNRPPEPTGFIVPAEQPTYHHVLPSGLACLITNFATSCSTVVFWLSMSAIPLTLTAVCFWAAFAGSAGPRPQELLLAFACREHPLRPLCRIADRGGCRSFNSALGSNGGFIPSRAVPMAFGFVCPMTCLQVG